ncbi:ionotropic receptor 25a isoform X2 [Periplaneta americana]
MGRNIRLGILLLFFMTCFSQFVSAVPINILFLNEERNEMGREAFNVALEFTKKKLGPDIEIGKVIRAEGNSTDARTFLESMCSVYNDSIAEGSPPHIVMDMTMSGVASETAKSFTAALALPTISTSFGQEGDLRQWRSLNEDEKKYLIQIMPPADIIPEIVRSIVIYQNITNAGILFDDTIVMDHKYKSLLQNIPTRHMIVKVDMGNTEGQLKRLRERDIFNYFILGRIDTIKAVLDGAEENGFFDRQFAWHGITMESNSITCKCYNATVFYVKPTPNPQYTERFKALTDQFGLSKTPEISNAFYFDVALRTIIATKKLIDDNGEGYRKEYVTCNDYDENTPITRSLNLADAFTSVSEPYSYGPINIESNGKSMMEFEMEMETVTILENTALKKEHVANWKAGLMNALDVKDGKTMNQHSAVTVYRIVTVVQKPFVMYDGVDEKNRTKFKGYCINLIDEIRNITKFDYEIYEAPDKKFGNMDEMGKWNGMINELILKNADIALGSLSVMAERENVVDFTVPYYDLVGITILMKKPKAATSLFKFLTVLENDVWLCILAAYFFTSFLMWVFDRWSPYSYQNNREKYKDDEEKREFNLKECLWFCMTSLTPQGGGEAPKNLSGRLVAATWWLFGFIIIASYTANLAAFLTVSRLDTPVESLDDLAKQYKIQYAPLNNSAAQTYFKRMADIETRFYEIWKDMSLNDSLSDVERAKLAVWDYPVSDKYTKIWQAMKEAGFPESLDDAVDKVLKSKSSSEGFAYIGDATDIRYLVLTSCDLQMVGEEFSRKPYAIATQQGSPLKDQFNNAILQLLNKRKLEKLKEQWWNQNPEKKKNCEKQDDQTDGISIQNIGGVFIVIFVGIGLACITLAFEYWWYRFKKSPQVVDAGNVVVQPRQIPTAGGGKMDQGLTMQGFRSRNPTFPEHNFRRHAAPLTGVANPW